MSLHTARETYAKMVYQNSGNDLLVTQQALRHTSIETTLYYLDTLSDNVTQAMPDFDFSEPDVLDKTSGSKIVYLSEVALRHGRRESEKPAEDGKKQIS